MEREITQQDWDYCQKIAHDIVRYYRCPARLCQDAEDSVASEIAYAAYPKSSDKGWLWRSARNAYCNWKKRYNTHNIDAPAELSPNIPERIQPEDPPIQDKRLQQFIAACHPLELLVLYAIADDDAFQKQPSEGLQEWFAKLELSIDCIKEVRNKLNRLKFSIEHEGVLSPYKPYSKYNQKLDVIYDRAMTILAKEMLK